MSVEIRIINRIAARFLFSIGIVLLAHLAIEAQDQVALSIEVREAYSAGLEAFDQEDYLTANVNFRKALATNDVLPTDLSYYFAETLYHLRQFQNARNFIEKYLTLTGQTGDFFKEAAYLQQLLEEEFTRIQECQYCNVFGYRLITCEYCNATGIETSQCPVCNGTGESLCPRCLGKGITITTDAFNQHHYEECQVCVGDGIVTCERCHGEKVITERCHICLGSTVRSTSTICNHEEHQEILRQTTN